ncbi:MAG: ACT domain-containing protein [Pseudomonadota bacterium]
MKLEMTLMREVLAVCRLEAEAVVPAWLDLSAAFFALTRSNEELSVVCAANLVPDDVTAERDWRAFKVEGPLDFALTGIMAKLTAPLAAAGISIFAISTYDTDYLLVREGAAQQAAEILRGVATVSDQA